MAVDLQQTKDAIQSILSGVRDQSSFAYASNLTCCPNPGLYINGLGNIGLPLSTRDAEAIVSKAKQSPFGHKEATIIDTAVRRSWELNPSEFALQNLSWLIQIQNMVSAVQQGLKLKCGVEAVSAELYKLLLYEPGAFFKPHRDSEKTPGMFGTLIVCLPTPHEGGELVLTHGGQTFEHKTQVMSDFNFSFAAWYSDITHEVKPVTSGYRLVLTYNLVRKDAAASIPLRISSATTAQGLLQDELRDYNALVRQKDRNAPKFLVYKLDHKYTQASLSMKRLETQDYDRVQLLHAAARSCDLDVYLATLEKLVVGDEDDDDHHEEMSNDLKHVVDLDGNHIADSIVLPKNSLIGREGGIGEHDESEYEGWTGNEGTPINYWYRDTVVMIAPRQHRIDLRFENIHQEHQLIKLLNDLKGKAGVDHDAAVDLVRLCQLAPQHHWQRYKHDIWRYGGPLHMSKESDFIIAALQTLLELDMQPQMNTFATFAEAVRDAKVNEVVACGPQLASAMIRTGFLDVQPALDAVSEKTISQTAVHEQILNRIYNNLVTGNLPQNNDVVRQFEAWRTRLTLSNLHRMKPTSVQDGEALGGVFKSALTESAWKTICSTLEQCALAARIGFLNTVIEAKLGTIFAEYGESLRAELVQTWQNFTFAAMVKESWKKLEGHSINDPHHLRPKIRIQPDIVLRLIKNSLYGDQDLGVTYVCGTLKSAAKNVVESEEVDIMIQVLQIIAKENMPELLLDDSSITACQDFFTTALARYIALNIETEPQQPTDWKLPQQSCRMNCDDCAVVNKFLAHPTQVSYDTRVVQHRRKHLNETFDGHAAYDKSYSVEIIKNKSPHLWRITKNRRGHGARKAKWTRNLNNIKGTLQSLKRAGPHFQSYLGSYFDAIMSGRVEQVRYILAMPLSDTQPRAGSRSGGNTKRARDDDDGQENMDAKRTRSDVDETLPEVIDLT